MNTAVSVDELYKDEQAIESPELEAILESKGLSDDEIQNVLSKITVERVYQGLTFDVECGDGEILSFKVPIPKEDIN